MNLMLLSLLSGATLPLGAIAGPDPRDMSTNKPTTEQCAAAAREGRTLPGCTGGRAPSPTPGEVDEAAPPARFIVCPQDPRCPR